MRVSNIYDEHVKTQVRLVFKLLHSRMFKFARHSRSYPSSLARTSSLSTSNFFCSISHKSLPHPLHMSTHTPFNMCTKRLANTLPWAPSSLSRKKTQSFPLPFPTQPIAPNDVESQIPIASEMRVFAAASWQLE